MSIEQEVQIAIAPRLADIRRVGTIQAAYEVLADCFIEAYRLIAPEAVKRARDTEEFPRIMHEVAPRECAAMLIRIIESPGMSEHLNSTVIESARRFFRLCAGQPPSSAPPIPDDMTDEFVAQIAAYRAEGERELITVAPALVTVRAALLESWIRMSATWEPPTEVSEIGLARKERLDAYLSAWRQHGDEKRSEARLCELAEVDRSDFIKWKKGLVKDKSVMSGRIDAELGRLPIREELRRLPA